MRVTKWKKGKDANTKKKVSIILFVNALYAGAGKILLFVADVCKNNGWNVTVASFYDDDLEKYRREGIDFINLNISTDIFFWRINALKEIRRTVKKMRPDIICAFVSDVVVMTRMATLGVNAKFIAAERGDPYTLPTKWIWPVRWAYGMSDYLVFQLKGAQDFFSKSTQRKSVIIPNPYTTKTSLEPYQGTRKKTIVAVGRFVEQKGFDVLIKAFRIFHESHEEYNLIIYGDGPLKNDLMQEVVRLKIQDYVKFPGFIQNIQTVIKDSSVYVLSSRFEGMPNALIEAMSVGVPTVSTDCTPGGPRYLTNNGRRGILVPVGDYEKMADAISTIIENKDVADEFSRMGLEIIDELDPKSIGEQWLRVFDLLV